MNKSVLLHAPSLSDERDNSFRQAVLSGEVRVTRRRFLAMLGLAPFTVDAATWQRMAVEESGGEGARWRKLAVADGAPGTWRALCWASGDTRPACAGRVTVNLTISANTNNYVLNTAKASGYLAGKTDVILTVEAGVIVGSGNTSSYSLDIDASWHADDTLTVINRGSILGRGGAGGVTGNGEPGGPALRAQRSVIVDNLGMIAGGGGGGGRGGTGKSTLVGCFPPGSATAVGGYGGAGRGSQGAATIGTPGSSTSTSDSCGTGITAYGGKGGDGGGYGVAGSSGAPGWQNTSQGPWSGGAGGACTAGNAFITWVTAGTRHGALN